MLNDEIDLGELDVTMGCGCLCGNSRLIGDWTASVTGVVQFGTGILPWLKPNSTFLHTL